MLIVRQSTTRTVTVGPVLDASGVAVTDGVVGDFKISKNGGAPAALNGSATLTHRHTGNYSLALTATDLDTVGQAEVTMDDTVNACAIKELTVIEEAVYDALYAASAPGYVANAPVNVAQFGGSNGTFASGRPEVNTTHLAGTSQTARDLGASVLLSPGTGSGQISLTSGAVTVGTLASGVITAGSIAASALNDKGNWLQPFVAGRTLKIDTSGSVEQVLLVGGLIDDAILASTFSSDARAQMASDAWLNGTRTLTSGTNIVLAKGVGLLGLNDIAATAVVSGGAITTSGGAVTTVTNVTNGVTIANGAITDASFTVPTVSGVATGILSKVVAVWGFVYLPSEYDPDEETFTTFAADGTTVVTTQSATVVGNVQRKGNAT